MILEIKTDGSKVSLGIDTGLDKLGYTKSMFLFKWDCGTEWAAALLVAQLRKQWFGFTTTSREAGYKHGWADAKAKRGKLY